MNWEPYATAPRDGSIVRLRDEKKLYQTAMYWDEKSKRWEGMSFGVMGSSKTYWDEDFVPIHEWQHLMRIIS